MKTLREQLGLELNQTLLDENKCASKKGALKYVFEVMDRLEFYTHENRLLFIQRLSSMYCDKCGADKDKESCPCYAY